MGLLQPSKLTLNKKWKDLLVKEKDIDAIRAWRKLFTSPVQGAEYSKKIRMGYHCLFFGAPGSGKKSLAALIGEEFKQAVYRIDLSQVVSKYIGETEKNLSKIFDMAEHKNWILFFDEADALFGKRSGVKDAHDRYANQEVSYLLQRMEEYNGLVILASNMKSNIDEAFARRINLVLNFTF